MRENLTHGFEIILKIDQNNGVFALLWKKLLKFSKDFPNNCVFRPNSENLTPGF